MKKSFLYFILPLAFLFTNAHVNSQQLTASDRKILKTKEDTLSQMTRYIVLDTVAAGRLLAYKDFVPAMIRALKVKNSFYYPFDSLLGVSRLYAPDSSFRIFTWYVEVEDFDGAQKGIIQHRTKDGSFKINWLFDNTAWTDDPEKKICRDSTWIGAVYYNMVKTQHDGKNYYTLFGFDRPGPRTNKKWIEVLHFDSQGQPVFGGPLFSFEEDSLQKPVQSRYSIEYKREARAFVNYEPEVKMILVDHLIYENDGDEFAWNLVPDGDYEGFKWKNGKWVHVDKVFHFKLEDGQAPVDDPILDIRGNKNEEKLKQKSDTNKTKKPGGNN